MSSSLSYSSPSILRFRRKLLILFVALGGSFVGCSKKLPPIDPVQAKAALNTALDAWKNGDSPEVLANLDPPITMKDWDWSAGVKLAGFEIVGDGKGRIGDWRCQVKLRFRQKDDRLMEQTASYAVKTGSEIKIMRASFQN